MLASSNLCASPQNEIDIPSRSGDSRSNISSKDLQFFESKVRPLLVEHCFECHSGKERGGGLSVESREQILAGGDTGPAMILGEGATKSLLLEAVSHANEHLKMPPRRKLAKEQVDILRDWLIRGAPAPRVPATNDSHPAPLHGMSLEEGKKFWSFRPVVPQPVPVPKETNWGHSPIDAFVVEQLYKNQLEPAPLADRQTFIRRIYLNLIGVPPTTEEVDEFVGDLSPTAYEALVDRLLASPQYGVRWGRHWLDVARYADSNGLDENIAYGNAWRYRDYVVKALNSDKPYNRFVVEQVAGDLLPEANRETKTASGFLSLGAKVLAEPDVEKLFVDTMDEQIDSLGKSFLGLTFGCARCHDHKFDPITQRDYYALAAIFKGTRTFAEERFGAIKYWYEHSFSSNEEREKLKVVDAAIANAKKAAANYKAEAIKKIRQSAQQHAADYLEAATRIPVGASLSDVSLIAGPLGLHPRILLHCRSHVENQKESEFYKAWHRLSSQSESVKQHYVELFEQVDVAVNSAKASDPKSESLSDPMLEMARKERIDPAAFLAIPTQPEYAFDESTLAEYNQWMEKARLLESAAIDAAGAMGVTDGTPTQEYRIHIRGNHLKLGEPIPRGFPAVIRTSSVDPIFSDTSSGRLELAEWLASTTNPLTARVIVNRVWGWHFGRPLVNTTENFGVLGERPSNPQLLDWLARNFMQSGWSIKQLHRMILNSSTYRMSSIHPNASFSQQIDPENRWLWKFPIQRLQAEQIRDSLLAVSDRLDWQLEGKSIPLRNRQFVFDHTSIDHTEYTSHRRAIYLPVVRNNLYTLFEQFDFPDPTMPTGHRNVTTVAPQSLLVMNNDLVLDSAAQLATTIVSGSSDNGARLEKLYLRLFARYPNAAEKEKCFQFIQRSSTDARLGATRIEKNIEQQAWELVVHALMATNDFLHVK